MSKRFAAPLLGCDAAGKMSFTPVAPFAIKQPILLRPGPHCDKLGYMSDLKNKFEKLQSILKEMENVLVAFSAGVDSTFLLCCAKEALNDKALAVTARSASFPQRELDESVKLAKMLKVEHLLIDSEELKNSDYRENPPDRCFYCKSDLFGKLRKIADEKGIPFVLDGANLDDTGDYRPGSKAAEELAVRSPLKEAELTKEDIRRLSKEKNLPTWNKPSFACLASRFPYGTAITEEKLAIVEQAENVLHELGFHQFRLRHHDKIARIEVTKDQLPRFLNNGISEKVISELKNLGYSYITVDLEGYRSGRMNDELKKS